MSSVQQNASTSSVKTVASAQPSDASINLAESKSDEPNTVRPPISAGTRFLVTLACLITQGIALILAEKFIASEKSIFKHFGAFFGLFTAFFTSEWIRIHSFGLTRQKRAFFDEVNILETYQPRARTMGHLFQPDPPTPGPVVKIADDPNQPARSASEQAAFNANRDAHYANMFEHAMRIAKESEEADRQALEAQKARLAAEAAAAAKSPAKSDSGASTATAVPKGEPLYDDVGNTNTPPPPPPFESVEGGTKLELPPSLREKADDKSIRVGGEKTTDGTEPTSPSSTNATTGTTTTTKTTDDSGSTDQNGNTVGETTTTGTETGTEVTDAAKTGRKRRKKNKK